MHPTANISDVLIVMDGIDANLSGTATTHPSFSRALHLARAKVAKYYNAMTPIYLIATGK